MDRFKFRVWDKVRGKYEDSSKLINQKGELVSFSVRDDLSKFYDIESCTGLRDKNGKLIYDGDFLGGLYGGYISWCDKCKSFELFFPEFGCACCNGDVLWQEIVEDDGILEILGNIHENADLLEN